MAMQTQLEFFEEFPQSADPWRDFDTPKRPPKKGVPELASTGTAKLQLIQSYPWPGPVQTCFGWRREAARLFCQFWLSGNVRHLRAFNTHVIGMRENQRGSQC
jgi:hypothetical protein